MDRWHRRRGLGLPGDQADAPTVPTVLHRFRARAHPAHRLQLRLLRRRRSDVVPPAAVPQDQGHHPQHARHLVHRRGGHRRYPPGRFEDGGAHLTASEGDFSPASPAGTSRYLGPRAPNR